MEQELPTRDRRGEGHAPFSECGVVQGGVDGSVHGNDIACTRRLEQHTRNDLYLLSHLRFPPFARSGSTHLLASPARWLPYIACVRIILYLSSIKHRPQTPGTLTVALVAVFEANRSRRGLDDLVLIQS